MGGVQSQYAPSSYIGLWTRLAGFQRAQLTRALERRAVAQGTLMRSTIHIVSARLLAARSGHPAGQPEVVARRDPSADPRAQDRGSRRTGSRAAGRRPTPAERARGGGSGWTPPPRGTVWAVGSTCCASTPSGTWERRSADLYGLAEAWLGGSSTVSVVDGLELIVRRYLRRVRPGGAQGYRELGGHLDHHTHAGAGADASAPVPLAKRGGELPRPALQSAAPRRRRAGARAIPAHVGYHTARERAPDADPAREIPAEGLRPRRPALRPDVPRRRAGVAGTWRHEGGRVRVDPFEPLPRAARREARRRGEAAGRLARLILQKSRRPSESGPAASGQVS